MPATPSGSQASRSQAGPDLARICTCGADRLRTLVDFDWLRVRLPEHVAPERQVRVDVAIPAIDEPGEYVVVFDLVIEGVSWFADRGSVPLEVAWRVTG